MVAFRGRERHDPQQGRNRLTRIGSRGNWPTRKRETASGNRFCNTFRVLRDRSMASIIRNAPYNVLVIMADTRKNVGPLLSALKPHFALVCTSAAQGIEAARQFEPDIVLIDLANPDVGAIVRDVLHAVGGREIVFVSMSEVTGVARALPPGFRYNISMPSVASELERLIWRIARELAVRPSGVGFPDSEMIG